MGNSKRHRHVLTLRLWKWVDTDGQIHWWGKIHHLQTDEIGTFNEWAALVPLLQSMVRRPGSRT